MCDGDEGGGVWPGKQVWQETCGGWRWHSAAHTCKLDHTDHTNTWIKSLPHQLWSIWSLYRRLSRMLRGATGEALCTCQVPVSQCLLFNVLQITTNRSDWFVKSDQFACNGEIDLDLALPTSQITHGDADLHSSLWLVAGVTESQGCLCACTNLSVPLVVYLVHS